jgi:hypothetical protein
MEKQANIDRNNMPTSPDAIANQNGVDHLKAPSSFDGVETSREFYFIILQQSHLEK